MTKEDMHKEIQLGFEKLSDGPQTERECIFISLMRFHVEYMKAYVDLIKESNYMIAFGAHMKGENAMFEYYKELMKRTENVNQH
jgi:hypothetical protein